ncbi:MAG: ATP-binding protein [Candidatus Sericytochromatia bacterium]|nr:ATP-binding protein [Candidatus Sericytochromatia bacterium]
MENKLKSLPLGIQTFSKIIESNNLYVDKTKDIYNIISSNESNFFFLSRPRRFGKSLLISTLDEIFSGNQELFKGLYIYDKIEWKKYPVIRIDFTGLVYVEGVKGFKDSFFNKIKNIGLNYQIELKSTDYKTAAQELIIELSKVDKVVILIDEYDKPIVEFIDNAEIRNQMKDIVKDFYLVIKESDKYIKFAFLTGVSKFSKISVFSGLNNLTDITLDKRFATITGYTEEELYYYFDDRIKLFAAIENITEHELKQVLREWYNGYSWDGKNFVYNPFSIMNVLSVQQINNYWFQSGTPTFLIKLIKDKNIDVKSLENIEMQKEALDSFEIENINVESLLFQTGYLTIKKIEEYSISDRIYILNYPNLEVRESLLRNILNSFLNSFNDDVLVGKLYRLLNKNNLDEFFRILKDIFSHIPAEIFMSDKEAYYHTIIYLILTLIGVRINVEVHTNKGRIDAVIETENNIYIIEFKMSSTKQALKQIEDKKYYESYLLSKKVIYLIGVSFSSKARNIKEYTIKELNPT